MNPSESFQEYHVDTNIIFFDTWDGIFGDMAKYYTMCRKLTIFWMIKWMINKMDELLQRMDAKPMINHG